ncbi:uncharacterized protein LOC120426803 [Culex pipiens pallens]|uniref:uncharacterized protein LOC120426803 n=1 Tax=Culex pipiens pallens TaxID=42434 RepID=UPI001953B91F|nr:uncharacterized protein LOC120426803 [Culex pipiens pallens]XP_039447523.1 uncharacterized protein LOC120426803 [Culex pipiens pallens]XP_052567051.1 uncharacterized protein LOC120426803 [Culex pipiens pallens]XP_052567052.1 uncharacterized protein LOC120426803 [Culex pipiens pallens]
MSKRLAVIAAVSTHNSLSNHTVSYTNMYTNQTTVRGHHYSHQGLQSMRPGAHGNVNIMLGGAMLSVVITVVFFVCYCCHRNIKKQSGSAYRQQWLEQEANMEIYSVEQCSVPGLSDNYLDISTGNEYQPLPAVMAVNHCHSAAYHHHQQHPASGGPPPSYDTVLAQDKMHAEVAAQWKELGLSYPTKGGLLGQKPELLEPTEFTDIREAIDCHNCCQVGGAGGTSLQVYCRNCGQFVDAAMVTSHDANNNENRCSPTAVVRNLADCTDPSHDDNGNLVNPETIVEPSEDANNNENLNDGAGRDDENNNNSGIPSGAIENLSNPTNRSEEAVTPGGSLESGSSGDSTIRNLNENGIVRLDMSRIIDQTGLPTYEAALKLESSGYV